MGGGISTVSFLFEYYGQLIYGHIPQTISYQAKVGINVVRKVSNKNYVHRHPICPIEKIPGMLSKISKPCSWILIRIIY